MKTIQLSNKVIVSDPCYDMGTWCQAIVDDVLPGKYNSHVFKTDDTNAWGSMCTHIVAIHEDLMNTSTFKWIGNKNFIGVDSGQAGIFCSSLYPQSGSTGEYGDINTFYGKCCNKTMEGYNELNDWYNVKGIVDVFNKGSKKHILTDVHPVTGEIVPWDYVYHYKLYNECKRDNDSMEDYHHHYVKLYESFLSGKDPKKPEFPQYGIIDGKGIISSSGFGDGSYKLYTTKKNKQVVGFVVDFGITNTPIKTIVNNFIKKQN